MMATNGTDGYDGGGGGGGGDDDDDRGRRRRRRRARCVWPCPCHGSPRRRASPLPVRQHGDEQYRGGEPQQRGGGKKLPASGGDHTEIASQRRQAHAGRFARNFLRNLVSVQQPGQAGQRVSLVACVKKGFKKLPQGQRPRLQSNRRTGTSFSGASLRPTNSMPSATTHIVIRDRPACDVC